MRRPPQGQGGADEDQRYRPRPAFRVLQISQAAETRNAAALTWFDEYPVTPPACVSTLSFKIAVNGQPMGFQLPCDWHPVLEILTKGKRKPPKFDERRYAAWEVQHREQAVRTACPDCAMDDFELALLPILPIESNRLTIQQPSSPPRFFAQSKRSTEVVATAGVSLFPFLPSSSLDPRSSLTSCCPGTGQNRLPHWRCEG
jgi:hypothetical protein